MEERTTQTKSRVRQSEARTWKQTKEKDGKISGTGANKRAWKESGQKWEATKWRRGGFAKVKGARC
jgi:hypothetical protein